MHVFKSFERMPKTFLEMKWFENLTSNIKWYTEKWTDIFYICHSIVCHYKLEIIHHMEGEMLVKEKIEEEIYARAGWIGIIHEGEKAFLSTSLLLFIWSCCSSTNKNVNIICFYMPSWFSCGMLNFLRNRRNSECIQ